MNLGASGVLVLLILGAGPVSLILGIVIAVEAGGLPDAAFERARTSKTLWIVLPLVGIVVCFMNLIVAIIWYSTIHGRVRAAAGL